MFLQQNRNVGIGGGVGIFFKLHAQIWLKKPLRKFMDWNSFKKFKISTNWLLLSTFWLPKESINNFWEVFEEQLTNVVKTYKEVIILGDFNIDHNKKGNRDFKSLINIFWLKQVITEPTRTTETSSTLIDLITTSRPESITNKNVFCKLNSRSQYYRLLEKDK